LGTTPYGIKTMIDLFEEGFHMVVCEADVGILRESARKLAVRKPSF